MYNFLCGKVIVFLYVVMILVIGSGIGCTPSFKYKYRQKSVQKRYETYMSDGKFRAGVDEKWLQSNDSLSDGFLPHPYGDEHLSDLGIEKIRDHQYSRR